MLTSRDVESLWDRLMSGLAAIDAPDTNPGSTGGADYVSMDLAHAELVAGLRRRVDAHDQKDVVEVPQSLASPAAPRDVDRPTAPDGASGRPSRPGLPASSPRSSQLTPPPFR